MRLKNEAHLAYCTNVHPGRDWTETFHSLQTDVQQVRRAVAPDEPYAIGLRLSADAARELSDPQTFLAFQRWLEKQNCYVFTINGFPYGNFHGERVKEQVYRPDWTSPDRLAYTNLLFDFLAKLLPSGATGSVSTLPGSFKRFIDSPEQTEAIYENLYRNFQHIEALSQKHNLDLHLGLEPEPLGLFETTPETIAFLETLFEKFPDAPNLRQRIGVNYDTCHLALQYEDAATSLAAYRERNIRVSKIHLSSALKVHDFSPATLETLQSFCEPTYLHQVLAANPDPEPNTQHPEPRIATRFEDLPEALAARHAGQDTSEEWRIHFHIPLHEEPEAPLASTRDHLLDTLDFLATHPDTCQHLEMETYTWAVLPNSLHNPSVADQVIREYQWLLLELTSRDLR